MLKHIKDTNDLRQTLLALLSTSGTLAGMSLALVGIVNFKASSAKLDTLADDIILFSSLGFLIVCYLIFFALRRIQSDKIRYWTNIIDILFLISLTLLVIAGFVIVYEFL